MQPRWRGTLKVHPAADVFPLLPKKELQELADDIREHGGLRTGVTLYMARQGSEPVLLDGRNRLDALSLLGDDIFDAKGNVRKEWYGGTLWGGNPVAHVISANIRRRHLTKRQQACLIVDAVKAGQTERAKVARSVKRNAKGQTVGTTKDPVKAQVVAIAAKQGISQRTATQALVDAEPERKRPKPKPSGGDAVVKGILSLALDPDAGSEPAGGLFAVLGDINSQALAPAAAIKPAKTPDPAPLDEVQDVFFGFLGQQATALAKLGRGKVVLKAAVAFGDGTVFTKTVRR